MIVPFSQALEVKRHKENVVKGALMTYYRDLNTNNDIDIPYFLQAETHYKELVHSLKDLNRLYKLVVGHNEIYH